MSAAGEAFAPAAQALDRFRAQHANATQTHPRPSAGYAVPVGPGTSRRMVMAREARCELGGREAASAAAIVLREGAGCVDRPVASDTVLTMGKPLKSCRRAAPFGLVLELWAPAWDDGSYDRLVDELRAPDWVEGCMLAVSGDTVRLRPSKTCLKAGFNEAQLGWMLVDLARSALPQATAVRVLVIADDGRAVNALGDAAHRSVEAGRALRRERYSRLGVDVDCPSGLLHCGACKDKETCVSVRRIERHRRNVKEERQLCTI